MDVIVVRKIVGETATIFGVKPGQIFGKTRKRPVVRARQVAIYTSRKMTSMTLCEIGTLFNLTHAIKTVAADKVLLLRAIAVRSSIMDIDIVNRIEEQQTAVMEEIQSAIRTIITSKWTPGSNHERP